MENDYLFAYLYNDADGKQGTGRTVLNVQGRITVDAIAQAEDAIKEKEHHEGVGIVGFYKLAKRRE